MRWPDPEVIQAWGMHEDFQAFVTTTGLLEFSKHPKKTYKEISSEFIATFRFEHIKSYKESKRGTSINGLSMKCNNRKSPMSKRHRDIHGATSRRIWESHDGKVHLPLVEIQHGANHPTMAEVQVVGVTTIQDTSFA
jgi:hypothetical protein